MPLASEPKIIISVNDGLASRYVLRSGVLNYLINSEFGIILISPNSDEDYFINDYEGQKVKLVLAKKPSDLTVKRYPRIENILIYLRRYSAPMQDPRHIQAHFYRSFLAGNSLHSYQKILFRGLRFVLMHSRFFRQQLLSLEKLIANPKPYQNLYREFDIKALVTCGMGYVYTHEGYLLREAADHKVPMICAIPNWDHPTTKGLRAAKADHYLVWGPAMREEWIRYQDTLPERVHVTGSAAFDLYANPGTFLNKKQFSELFNLDPNKKIILFATHSPTGFPYNFEIASELIKAIREGTIKENCQLIVRIHPNFFKKDVSHDISCFLNLEKDIPFVRLSIPKIYSEKLYGDMPMSENIQVANLAYHADVIVTVFSTMQLDGCICDTPVINVGFPMGNQGFPWFFPENQEHYIYLKRVVQMGSVRVARTREELPLLINSYLDDPKKDSLARKKAVEQELGPTKGNAAQTISEFILSVARNGTESA